MRKNKSKSKSKSVEYRGFTIVVSREQCLAGYETTYFHAVRESDGWFMIDSFTEGEDSIDECIKFIKDDIDDYYENPSNWEDDEI